MRWVLVVAALACGCTDATTLDAETIAQTFCDCITPGATTACVAEVMPELATISAACSACVEEFETSCATLEDDCVPQCEEMTNGDT